jgi:hypothetical protein
VAVKNAVAKSWASLLTSFDGRKWSAWPAGDKPTGFQTSPTLVGQDKLSGSMVNNYNGKGCFLRLFGDAFGRQSDMGTPSGARVFVRDPLGDNAWHEVDNYRYLILSKVYLTHLLQELCVQIGNFGGSGVVNGHACDLKVTVNGVDSNVLVGVFTPNPGRFFYCDNLTGSDATGKPDDMAHPFRYVQNYSGGGSPVAGSLWAATTAQGDTGFQPGDTIIPRKTGTAWSDQLGYDSRFCRFKTHHGSPPTGSAGTGYMWFDSYPGPIGGNAPEDMIYADPPGGGGCLQGVGSSFALPIGTLGAGQYWGVSNWVMSCDATSRGDAGGVNLQYGSHHTRIVGCQFGPWPSSLDSRSGFVAGDGDTVQVLFNRSFDIECNSVTTSNLNHHVYFDSGNNGGTYNQASKNIEVAYNWCSNKPSVTTGGSLIQFFGQDATGGLANFTGINVHHNFLDHAIKYGINFGAQSQTGNISHNIVINTANAGIRMDTGQTGIDIGISHNLLWNNGTYPGGPSQGCITNEGSFGSGSAKIQHNTMVLKTGRGVTLQGLNDYIINSGTGTLTVSQNLYYDGDGVKSAYGGDATAVTGNPLWVTTTPTVPSDFTSGTGSPALGACSAAELYATAFDFFRVTRPVTGTSAPGGTKNDIGPFQGVRT